MQTIQGNEFSVGRAMGNFNPILLIFAIAFAFNLAYGQDGKGISEGNFNEDAGDSPKFSSRVARHDEEAADKHKELEQLRESPPSLVEDISEIAKHISKETATHEEMTMDDSLGQERRYNVHLHKPSIPPKRQVSSDPGIIAELDAHSCAQDASAFGHEHDAAVISHELLCEVSKLSQYLAVAQANLQKEISENSQSPLNQEYTELAAEEALANILENSVLLDGASQTAPPEAPSAVPVTSMQSSVFRLRDVLTRLTVHFEDVIVRTIGEHPELLEQLRRQLQEVENTLAQLRPDYDNFVNQLTETSRAVYQGILAAGMPAGESSSVPAANPPASAFVDPQQPVKAEESAAASIVNGQPINPFINARLLRRVLRGVVHHVIANLNVQDGQSTPEGSPAGGNGAPTYPFINEGFYGSLLKHIIKHLYTVPNSPVAPGSGEDATVDPLINASFLGGVLGHHPLYHHPYVYLPHIHYPIVQYHPAHYHILSSLLAEQDEPTPLTNDIRISKVLKHVLKHLEYVPGTSGENVQVEEPIINEHFLGSIVKHLAHRLNCNTEGESVAPPAVVPSPPVAHPSVPQNFPSFPSTSGTTYSQSSSSSYTAGAASSSASLTTAGAPGYLPGSTKSQSSSSSYTPGSASSSSTVTGASSVSSAQPASYTSPTYPGVSRPLAHVPVSSGATFSQSSSSSFSGGSASSSATLTGTSPVAQLAHSRPGQVYPTASQSGTNYPLPPVSQVGSNYPLPPVSQSGNKYPLPPVSQGGSNYPSPPVSHSGTNYPFPPVSQSGTNDPSPPVSHSGSNYPSPPVSQSGNKYPSPPVSHSGTNYPFPPVSHSGTNYPFPPVSHSGTNYPSPPVSHSGTNYPSPPVQPYSGTTHSHSSSSVYTPQSASSPVTASSARPSGNPLVPQPTKPVSSSSSYTPGSASSSSTVTGTSSTNSQLLYPHAHYNGPVSALPPLTSNSGSPSNSFTGTPSAPTVSSPQAYSNQGHPGSGSYNSPMRGQPLIPKPRFPVYPGTYSPSSSPSYTASSASSTPNSPSGFSNPHHSFPQPAPVQPKAPVNPHPSAPVAQHVPYSSHANTFPGTSSSSYTHSSSSTLGRPHIPTVQSAPVSGHRNPPLHFHPNPEQSGQFSTGSSSNYAPASSRGTSNVHPGNVPSSSSSQNLGRTQYDHSQHLDSHVSASEVVSNSGNVVKASSASSYSSTLLPQSQKSVAGTSVNVNVQDTLNVTLIFPQEKVASALGRKSLLPGDVVVISIKSGTILLGRVVDAVTPITFQISNSQPPFPGFRKEGRLWRLRARDFQDSQCRSQLNKLLEVINSQA